MSAQTTFKLLIRSAKQVVQVVKNGERVVKGEKMKEVAFIEGSDENGISIVVSKDGSIYDIGKDDDILKKYRSAIFEDAIDAHGQCVLPGFVDAHTHPVWAGDRVNEFAMKLAGATYLDIHKAGGGIYFTVEHTRKASENQLLKLLTERLGCMLSAGTTLVEAKSGYGLDVETEIKLLRVLELAKRNSPVEISTTYCGAHAIPKDLNEEEAAKDIIQNQLPKIKSLMDQDFINVENIDVFCEKNVFHLIQTRRILEAGRSMGLRLNFHADELFALGGSELAADLKAEAIAHLEKISDAGIKAISESGTIAVVLPTTAYMLRLEPPPVRKMLESGVAVALGSDFNPNAFCMSMPMVMHLACVLFKMTMAEALVAATINSAAALGRSETHGSLEKGKQADMILINASRWEHIIYQFGGHGSLITHVIKNGDIVYKNMNFSKLV